MPESDQVLTWLLVGALAGAAAGSLIRRKLYFYELVLAGLLGALVGGLIMEAVGVNLPDQRISFTLGDLLAAFIGAAVLVGFAEMVIGVRRGSRS